MTIYELKNEEIVPFGETTFSALKISERGDLQRLLRDQVNVICPDTLVISEEFGDWDESRRRIDLLGIDKDANIVVIELKRTEDGGHMELQSLRYAAMVSTITFENAVATFEKYLKRRSRDEEARSTILDFLEWDDVNEEEFASDVRIVLASAEFSKELTTSVMWLNERDLDIICIRLKPYKDGDRVLLDVQQIIPLVEAEDYQIRLRQKKERQRETRRSTRDFTKFDVVIGEETYSQLPKRQAIFTVVKHLCDSGVSVEDIKQTVSWRTSLFKEIAGEHDSESFITTILDSEGRFDSSRFFCADNELIHENDRTFALTNQWGNRTRTAINDLIEANEDKNISCVQHGKQKWNKSSFLTSIETKLGKDLALVGSELISWIEPKVTRVWWGEGSSAASFVAIQEKNESKYHLFRIDDKGKVSIWLHSLKDKQPFKGENAKRMLEQLNKIPSVDFSTEKLEGRAKFELDILNDPDAMSQFKSFCDWMIAEIGNSNSKSA